MSPVATRERILQTALQIHFLYVEDDTERNVERGDEDKHQMKDQGQTGAPAIEKIENVNEGDDKERDDSSETAVKNKINVMLLSKFETIYLENK